MLTFSTHGIKEMREALLTARDLAESIVDTIPKPLVVVDGALRIVSASRSFYQRFSTTPEKTVGCLLYQLGNGQWNIPALRELLETVLPQQRSFDDFKVEHGFRHRSVHDAGQRPLHRRHHGGNPIGPALDRAVSPQ